MRRAPVELQEAVAAILNTFAGTITGIIVIAGVIAKIRPIGRAIKKFFFQELYEANEKQDKRLDNLELQQLKQIICDRRLPDGERLNAGEEYIKRGGNGEIKMIYDAIMESAKKKHIEEQEQFEQKQVRKRRGGNNVD
jgi:uncharacterized membrane protein